MPNTDAHVRVATQQLPRYATQIAHALGFHPLLHGLPCLSGTEHVAMAHHSPRATLP